MKTIFSGYAFDMSMTPPLMAHHEMRTDSQILEHVVDGKLRASVPVESMADYLNSENIAVVGHADPNLFAARRNIAKPQTVQKKPAKRKR